MREKDIRVISKKNKVQTQVTVLNLPPTYVIYKHEVPNMQQIVTFFDQQWNINIYCLLT